MRRFLTILLGTIIIATLVVAGCATPASQTPTATKPAVTAAPTQAAVATQPTAATTVPTAAAATAPAAAPTKDIGFPKAGKTVTMLVGQAAGGPNDVLARMIASYMEKKLKTPVVVVNKTGGGQQVAVTELAMAQPDGYTIMNVSIPTLQSLYLDQARNPTFGRKDLQPIAGHTNAPGTLVVKANSPFTNVKDFVEAAKAKPGVIKLATTGFGSINHLAAANLEKKFGIQTAMVHFDGVAPAMTALLGGHVDVLIAGVSSNTVSPVKGGLARFLGVMAKEKNEFVPDVPTFRQQGYEFYSDNYYSLWAPGGTPREIVDLYCDLLEEAVKDKEFQKAVSDAFLSLYFMPTDEYTAYADAMEADTKAAIELVRLQSR